LISLRAFLLLTLCLLPFSLELAQARELIAAKKKNYKFGDRRARAKKNPAPPSEPLPKVVEPTASSPSALAATVGEPVYGLVVEPSTGWGSVSNAGSAVTMGLRFGIPISSSGKVYFGPQVDYLLFSEGVSLANLLASAWWQFRLAKGSLWTLVVGGSGGAAVPYSLVNYPRTSWVAYFETALDREIDDLASVRLVVRPGLVHGNFSLLINVGVSFRFL
jgi:hypothetical protein